MFFWASCTFSFFSKHLFTGAFPSTCICFVHNPCTGSLWGFRGIKRIEPQPPWLIVRTKEATSTGFITVLVFLLFLPDMTLCGRLGVKYQVHVIMMYLSTYPARQLSTQFSFFFNVCIPTCLYFTVQISSSCLCIVQDQQL